MSEGTNIARKCAITLALIAFLAIDVIVWYANWKGWTSLANDILALPCFILAALLWMERSFVWVIYLCALSVAFGLYGPWEVTQRTLIYYHSTLSGLQELTAVEVILLLPPVIRLVLRMVQGLKRKGFTN